MGHETDAIEIKDNIQLGELGSKLFKGSLGFGVLGLGVAALLGYSARDGGAHFMHAYLVNLMYFLSIALGALFFVTLQHLVRAGWSVTVRRLAELMAGALPVLAVLFLPILVAMLAGQANLYSWVDSEMMHNDHLLHKKMAFLNVPFFAARCAIYFGFWALAARYWLRRSTAQDQSGDILITARLQSVSAPAMILFALTLTYAAFDLLMSLTPTWYSTIFGVYFFAGCVMSFFAAISLFAMLLQRSGRLATVITTEHYQDLGKFLFGFVFFWGYIGFSQFMLIWYANIPEETEWYAPRMAGGWGWMSLALLFGHFCVPFLGLVSRHVKRNRFGLAFWATFLLVMHWIDLYWIVMPHLDEHHIPFGMIDVACLLGVGGVVAATVAYLGSGRALVPVRDPRLSEALAFENS